MTPEGARHDRSGQAELETRLRAVARRVTFPPTPDLWPGIEQQLLAEPAANPIRPFRWRSGPLWRLAAAALVLLLILAAAVAIVPDFRRAVADRLGLTGAVIQFVEEPFPPPTQAAGAAIGLGRPVSLEEAMERATFPLRVPTAQGLGLPETIYITYGPSDPMVSFVYPASDHLPPSRFTGVGALLTQFEGSVERAMIAKGLQDDSAITATRVHDLPAYWIDGAGHSFMYLDPAGEVRTEAYRLAGNVLLWEAEGVTYRFESELSREAATAVAESMEPIAVTGTN